MELPRYAYFEGKIVPFDEARISILTHALHYGTAAFGGLRAYWNQEQGQLFLFRPEDHYRRLLNSARLLLMDFDFTPEDLIQLSISLLRREELTCDIYLRPLVYKADMGIGVRLHDLKEEIALMAVPFDRYVVNDTDAHVTISSWRRIDDNAIPAREKLPVRMLIPPSSKPMLSNRDLMRPWS